MWDNMLFMISWEDVKAENQGRANAYTNLGNLSILEDLTFLFYCHRLKRVKFVSFWTILKGKQIKNRLRLFS